MTIKYLMPALLLCWNTVTAAEQENLMKTDTNPCEGMAEGEYMGVEACDACHEDKVTGMRSNPHGQAADARTPFGIEGCESCHGPGTTHFDVEGNCIISLRGRFGESVEQRNGICLECHKNDGDMMHWQGGMQRLSQPAWLARPERTATTQRQ